MGQSGSFSSPSKTSNFFSNLRIRSLFRLRLPWMQSKFSSVFLKKWHNWWPCRLQLLPEKKRDSGSRSVFSLDSGSGSERQTQNPAGVDYGTPDPWPPLVETKTWLKLRERSFIKKCGAKTETWKFETETKTLDLEICQLCKLYLKFLKNIITASKLKFFRIFGFFTCFRLPLPTDSVQQTENRLKFKSYTTSYLWSIRSLKII